MMSNAIVGHNSCGHSSVGDLQHSQKEHCSSSTTLGWPATICSVANLTGTLMDDMDVFQCTGLRQPRSCMCDPCATSTVLMAQSLFLLRCNKDCRTLLLLVFSGFCSSYFESVTETTWETTGCYQPSNQPQVTVLRRNSAPSYSVPSQRHHISHTAGHTITPDQLHKTNTNTQHDKQTMLSQAGSNHTKVSAAGNPCSCTSYHTT
jgi:hypothetical protein